MVYVCYDNGVYMNIGIQRFFVILFYVDIIIFLQGKVILGKMQWRKDLIEVMVVYGILYVVQIVFIILNFKDLIEKVEKVFYIDGLVFLNVLVLCLRGWRYEILKFIEILKFVVDICFWLFYEVVNGQYRFIYKLKEKFFVVEFLKI